MSGLNTTKLVLRVSNEFPEQTDDRLEPIPEFDIDGWSRIDSRGDEIILMSDDRRGKVSVKAVSVQNDQFDHAYLIEYYRGEESYSAKREKEANTMAPTPSQVPVQIRELIADH